MSIENVGAQKNLIKNYDANSWAKNTEINTKNSRLNSTEINLDELKSARSFTDMLVESMSKVNNLQTEANSAIEKLAAGKTKNIHETMLAVEKADIAFKTMNQIRSKVIDAYKEVMRMQV
jgi:flagellar hook-basal body complex protein FliE